MKKNVVLLSLLLFSSGVFAQNEDYPHVVSVQSGVSLFSAFRGNISGSPDDTVVSFSSGRARNFPQLNIAYDYGVVKWFSIGGAISYNKVSVDLKDVKYNRTENLGEVNLALSRVTIGARALFHYGNSDRLDMYSGVRIGAGIWGVKVGSASLGDKANEIVKEAGGNGIWRTVVGNRVGAHFALPQVQVLLFGFRGYVTENLGINGEVAVGSPYFVSLGLNYRIGTYYE